MAALKRLSASSGRSVADLVREGVTALLRTGGESAVALRRVQALEAVGKFASGHSDVSSEHDRHLSEAFGK